MNHSQAIRSRSTSGGFSLIELLIVIAIILVIAAIAIPSYLRSRTAADETAAVSNLRNITTANVSYSSTYGMGYASTLAALGPPPPGTSVSAAHASLIDSILASGTKSGYRYTYLPGAPDAEGKIDTFEINADPVTSPFSGSRHFFTDQTGVIRQNLSGKAGSTDPPVS